MINIDGIEYRTAAQWEKKHRHVLKGQLKKGVERSWRSPNGNETMLFTASSRPAPGRKRTSRLSTAAVAPTPRRSATPRSANASRAPPARNSIAKTFSIVGGLASTRKPCRRAAATTPPTSGAISASSRLPGLGGGLPDTEAIPHGITALPGMCAMTPTALKSCWRRGRASTTDFQTAGPTTATPGGKRKKRGGSKTLPVSLAVSTSLPASPVDPASVVNIDNKDDENIVLDIGDYPIVTDPIAPET